MRRVKIIISVFFLLIIYGSYAQDTSKQFFSLGFGDIILKQFIPKPRNGNTIEVPNVRQGGVYLDINFRGKKWGFNTGVQLVTTGYTEKFPVINDTMQRQIGLERSYFMKRIPIGLDYKMIDHNHWKVFLKTAVVYYGVTSELTKIYNSIYISPYTKAHKTDADLSWGLSWIFGINAERNLYKRDLSLSTQLNFNGQSFRSRHNYLAFSIGLNIIFSNISYKEKMYNLKRYPERNYPM